jgi:hypothetical protein
MGALANVKITLFFEDGVQGWSETHFTPYTSIGNKAASYKAMQALANARVLTIDGKNVTLIRARASLDNVNRDRQLLLQGDMPIKNAAGLYPGGIQAGTTPWAWQTSHVSWVADMDTVEEGVNPTLYIAGLPANTGQLGDNAYTATAPSPGSVLESYLNVLTNGNYGCSFRLWPTNPPTVGTSIQVSGITWTAAAGAMPNTLTFTPTPPGSFAAVLPNQYVRLWGATYTSVLKRQRYNGTYKALQVFAGALVVAAPRITVAPTWGLTGYVQLSTTGYTPYIGYTIGGITHRKRGRPTSAARGRR